MTFIIFNNSYKVQCRMTNTELTATVLSMNYGNIGMYAIHSRKTMVITLCIYPVLFHSFIYCEIPS